MFEYATLLEYWNPTIEECGVITCEGKILQLKNYHPNPTMGFWMQESDFPTEVPLVGTWHTHPHGGANLSVMDYRLFLQYPKFAHLIVGRGIVWEYFVEDNRVFRK